MLSRLLVYVGTLALLAIAGVHLWDELPATEAAEPVAKAGRAPARFGDRFSRFSGRQFVPEMHAGDGKQGQSTHIDQKTRQHAATLVGKAGQGGVNSGRRNRHGSPEMIGSNVQTHGVTLS